MISENELEQALRLAATSVEHRPDFYKKLLQSDVFIIGRTQAGGEGESRLDAGQSILIQNWQKADGVAVIPFFTSLEMLQRSIDQECTYIQIASRALFETTAGAILVLNPRSKFGKEFSPAEINSLLSGGLNIEPEVYRVEKPAEVLLGQPQVIPEQLVQALSAFFANRAQVVGAYLALMHDPSRDEEPHLIVGIELDEGDDEVIREAGAVAADALEGKGPLDLLRIVRGDSGLAEYFFSQVQPFFSRKESYKGFLQ